MVARTFRLPDDLVARLDAKAAELGQSRTVFVVRALEQALGPDGFAQPAAPSGDAPAPVRAPVPPSEIRPPSTSIGIPERFETAVQRKVRLADERIAIRKAAVDKALGG